LSPGKHGKGIFSASDLISPGEVLQAFAPSYRQKHTMTDWQT